MLVDGAGQSCTVRRCRRPTTAVLACPWRHARVPTNAGAARRAAVGSAQAHGRVTLQIKVLHVCRSHRRDSASLGVDDGVGGGRRDSAARLARAAPTQVRPLGNGARAPRTRERVHIGRARGMQVAAWSVRLAACVASAVDLGGVYCLASSSTACSSPSSESVAAAGARLRMELMVTSLSVAPALESLRRNMICRVPPNQLAGS